MNAPPGTLFAGQGTEKVFLTLKFANRHGLVTGATGTGKTVTLQTLAERFSRAGVPVFAADVKGDLAGVAVPGRSNPKVDERRAMMGIDEPFAGCPTVFWDLFGKSGHPVRATVTEIGPLLLSRMLELNDTQEGVLNIAFKVADDNQLLLLDLKDLRAILQFVSDQSKQIQTQYGNVSAVSVGAIQRQLLILEQQGAEAFFGEPALELSDLMRCDADGQGYVNILAADELIHKPRLYATFLLWLVSELFENLPEVGDPEKPKLVFFFDEAHLLFSGAPKALIDRIEQVVRLIRSKGVGVYFVTQNPLDVPEIVLGQLGNRFQHALRAYTPRDQKAVKTAADTFRQNPDLDTATVITELGVGEALVSTLEDKGAPSMVQRVFIAPPYSQIGPIEVGIRAQLMNADPIRAKYDQVLDRESAFEIITARLREEEEAKAAEQAAKEAAKEEARLAKEAAAAERAAERAARSAPNPLNDILKSASRSAGTTLGREITKNLSRGVLGSVLGGLFGGGRRR
jgi:hypothetical protein